MASGQLYGGMDGKLDQSVDENLGGMKHKVKWMADEGPLTQTNKFTRPGGGGTAEPSKDKD